MDNRLFLTALVVTLSWMSLGSNAQNTTTAGNNMTTSVENNGTTAVATAGNNATTAAATAGNNATTAAATAGNNATTAATTAGNNATTAAATVGKNETTAVATAGNNATTAGNNATTAAATAGNNATTAGNNATTAAATAGNNVTTAGNNATTAAATAGNNATTAAATAGINATTAAATAGNNATTAAATAGNNATAPPLTPNTTVEILGTPVSRAQCGKQQLCAAEPSQCDPSTPGSCFFLAAKQINGNNFEFGLSGVSNGYIAASLSPGSTQVVNATTYVCANNGGVVKFFGTLLNNGQLIPAQLNVNSVKGSVNGNKIQCTFAATVPTPSTRAGDYTLQIATGSFDSTSGVLGQPIAQLRSTVSDLANPSINVTNTISSSSTTTLQQSMTQAMMITVAVLGLAML